MKVLFADLELTGLRFSRLNFIGFKFLRFKFVFLSLFVTNPSYAATVGASHTANAISVVALYIAFCGWFIWRYKKRIAQDLLQKNRVNNKANLRDENTILIAYASQTGNAEQLSQKTAESLKASHLAVEMHALSDIDHDMLTRFTRVLFIVSTTGEGDAPDNAREFLSKVMLNDANFSNIKYGILALGDISYTHYCGFGHTLDKWLQLAHALPLFDMIEVDRNDDGALRHWQYQLGVLTQDTEMVDWKTPDYQQWKLTARILMNQGSVGAPVYHLKLTTNTDDMRWQAGDIAEIGPRNSQQCVHAFLNHFQLDGSVTIKPANITFAEELQDKLLPHDEAGFKEFADLNAANLHLKIVDLDNLDSNKQDSNKRPSNNPDLTKSDLTKPNLPNASAIQAEAILSTLKTLPHREYSIASIPQDGALELLIRQTHYADGRLGIGSGWLTEHAALDSDIALRIRENSAFHPPSTNIPLILIGNGTGIAGLRAHLKTRAALQQNNNWLIFGERNAAHDFYFKDELHSWQNQGALTKIDTAFSRDQAESVYVQDIVKSSATDILKWVENGAAIYVCGSANGMAPAVHNELLNILGEAKLAALTNCGKYRRDIY